MPWSKVKFQQTTATSKLGTLIANHDNGFVYQEERVNIGVAKDKNDYIARAKSALVSFNAKQIEYNADESTILINLNI